MIHRLLVLLAPRIPPKDRTSNLTTKRPLRGASLARQGDSETLLLAIV
jgi:hypothetical protein